jgi:hypothetical protein
VNHTFEDSIREIRAVTEASNKMWYRLYMPRSGRPKIVHVNWYDELDYGFDNFVSDERYEKYADAIKAWGHVLAVHGGPTCRKCGRILVCSCEVDK